MAAEEAPPPAPDFNDKAEGLLSSVPLWLVVFAAIAVGGVVEVIIYGYLERPGWIGVAKKSFWDYLELLIVPAALALGVYWLTRRQQERVQAVENRRAEAEQTIQQQNAQDGALQAYLDQMSSLLLEQDLRESEEDSEVQTLARARTLTVLERLDSRRKTQVLRFLVDANLVQGVEQRAPVIALFDAVLTEANLRGVDLRNADLRGTELRGADLRNTDLSKTNLSGNDLSGTNLRGANLSGTVLDRTNLSGNDLSGTNLSDAILRGAELNHADLRDATMSGADLSEANLNFANLSRAVLNNADLPGAELSGANMSGAFLRYADLRESQLIETNLSGADLLEADLGYARLDGAKGVTEEQLEEAKTLKGATMPGE